MEPETYAKINTEEEGKRDFTVLENGGEKMKSGRES